MDQRKQLQDAESRQILRAQVRTRQAEIERIEEQLRHIFPTGSPTEQVECYLRLGIAYGNLLDFFSTSGNVTHQSTFDIDPSPAAPPLPSSNTTFSTNFPTPAHPESLTTQNILAIANTCLYNALDIVNQETYPNKDHDKRRIEEAIRSLIDQEKRTGTEAKKERERSREVLKMVTTPVKPPYKGYWVSNTALRLPLLWLAILLPLSLTFSVWHVSISLALHIPPYDCIPGTIIVNGSTAVFPLMNIAAAEYHKLCPSSTIEVNPGKLPNGTELPVGSINGLNQILNNTIDIATSDTYADTTFSELKEHPLVVIPLALVVKSDVTNIEKPNLSSDQIASIYGSSVSTWSQVDSAWNSENITLVSRPASSETRAIFEKYILGDPEAVPGPPRLVDDTSATVANSICTTSGAIGYIPLYYYYDYSLHHNHCLRLITIDHNDPQSPELIKNNTYKFWYLEHIYTKSSPKGLAQSFINFMYTDSIKSYISQYDKYGYLDPADISSDLLASH